MALLITLLFTTSFLAQTPDLVSVTNCEDLNGWGKGVILVDDSREGKHAVAWNPPPGKLSFIYYNLRSSGASVAQAERLAFWYKIEGKGVRSFMIKIIDFPLAGGMQATWRIADSRTTTDKWLHAEVDIQHPHYLWGNRPDKKSRTLIFRVETEKRSNIRLLIDDVVLTPQTFEAVLQKPQKIKTNTGLTFKYPIKLTSHTDKALRLYVSANDRTDTIFLEPRKTIIHSVVLYLTKEWLKAQPPLASRRSEIILEAEGMPHSRKELTAIMTKPLELPPHPRLLFNKDDLAAIRQRIETMPSAKARYESIKKNADNWCKRKIKLPDRGGQWWHWYACPKHGARLKTKSPTEHVCPIDGEVFSGYPYDDVVLSREHSSLARAIYNCGLVYQISGDVRYAAKAREILLAYAEKYRSYPLHNIHGKPVVGGGRVGPQSLDESTWLLPVAEGTDLIWDTLSEDEIAKIKEGLFYPAAVGVIQKHRMGIHNIQCWKNSAVGVTGFLLGDEDLIRDAIESPSSGYRQQMAKGVTADGEWYEGAWGYHFYTLSALWHLTEAAYHCGINLYGTELKRMFDAPINLAMPNLHLPAFNDSGMVNIAGSAWLYELAYARYGDERYKIVLSNGNRKTDHALLYGVSDLGDVPSLQPESNNFTAAGYAVLTQGKGKDATWLALDYGPHGGGHGHPDKLGFVLYSRGRVIAPDPGTALYGVPIQRGWYRQTLAHNTLTVDEVSQRPAEGKSEAFLASGNVTAAIATAGDIYPGVQFRRTVGMIGTDLVIFIDQIAADEEHTYDLAYHNYGKWISQLEASPVTLPDKPGYRYLRDMQSFKTDDAATLTCEVTDGLRTVWLLAGGESTDVIFGTGVGENTEDRVPIVIARRHAKDTTYAWCIILDKQAAEPPHLQLVSVKTSTPSESPESEATSAVRVTYRGMTHLLIANPSGQAIVVDGWETDAELACVSISIQGKGEAVIRATAPVKSAN